MNEVKAWDGKIWKVGEKVGYNNINLLEYKGTIVEFTSANMCTVLWTHSVKPAAEFIPNLRRLQ